MSRVTDLGQIQALGCATTGMCVSFVMFNGMINFIYSIDFLSGLNYVKKHVCMLQIRTVYCILKSAPVFCF